MRALKAIIALLFVLAGIIIGALNQQSVDIDLLFFHYQAHIGLALILSIKKQQAVATAWLAEAHFRDRGVGD